MKLINGIEEEITGFSVDILKEPHCTTRGVKYTKEGWLHVVTYEVKNDIEVDFMTVEQCMLSFDLKTFFEVRNNEGVHAAIEWLNTVQPVAKTFIKEHVYDNPMKCELEYMDELEVFECIQEL